MNLTKSYIEGLKQRVELVRKAYTKPFSLNPEIEYHTRNLIEYLDGLDYFLEEEKKMTCEICHNPLYVRQDGSLTCVEMHH